MKKLSNEQLKNIEVAMARINTLSIEAIEDAKGGAKIAKGHMIKVLKYLVDKKDAKEINALLLNCTDLTEEDITPLKIMEVVKEMDNYQLQLMEMYLDMSKPAVIDFLDFIKGLTSEFEEELKKALAA